jgi:hypothetical protein
MIHAFGSPHPPVPRLVAALAARGHALARGSGDPPGERSTLVLGPGIVPNPMAIATLLGAWKKTPGGRVLVLSLLGCHRDAVTPRLRDLWDLEEEARRSGLPTLTLRLAPLLGPESPLWLRLRSRPRVPHAERILIQPLVEEDAVETLDRALRGSVPWRDWYELPGPEVLSLAELLQRAAAAGPALPGGVGAWEPPIEEMREHRLAETEPWSGRFGITPRAVGERMAAWCA